MSAAADGRFFRLVLVAALLAGAGLRLHDAGSFTLTHWDEGSAVAGPLGIGPYARGEPQAVYAPPLVPSLNRLALALAGADPRAAVWVAALFGVAGIAAAAFLARRWFGAIAGGVAAVFLALDPFHVGYSRMALTESAFTFFFLVALLALTRALEDGSRRAGLAGGAATGACFAVKYHGFLPLAAAFVAAAPGLVRSGPGPAARRRALLAAGLAALPFAAGVAWFVHRDMGFERFAETRRTWVVGLHLWSLRTWLETLLDCARYFGSPALLVLAPLGAVLAGRPRTAGRGLALVAPLALALLLAGYRPYTRLLVPFFALLVPLAAHAVAALCGRVRRAPRGAALALAVVAALPAFPALRAVLAFEGGGYPRAAALLEAALARSPGDVILVGQHALYPYLSRATAAHVYSTSEPEGALRIDAGDFDYVLCDQDPARHAVAAPLAAARLEALSSLDNPLPGPILYDRLGAAGYRAWRGEPGAAAFAAETRLRWFRHVR